MRFTYSYNSKENARLHGEICAADRNAAYAALRTQGIRPIRVDEVPGLWNKLLGKGKRWMAIAVLAAALVSSLLVLWRGESDADEAGACPRHHIYGDPALLDEIVRCGYSNVFEHACDRYLAHFAQPGVDVKIADPMWRTKMAVALGEVAKTSVVLADADEREVRELKRIVMGMRDEFVHYLSDGVGTPEKYVTRLLQRQKRELVIFYGAQNDLKNERDEMKWDRINRSLKAMGLPTLVMPNEGENFFQKNRQPPLTPNRGI